MCWTMDIDQLIDGCRKYLINNKTNILNITQNETIYIEKFLDVIQYIDRIRYTNVTRYNNITVEALQTFDFINLMAYDFTGPWNPTVSGQHSSYNHSLESINFWNCKKFSSLNLSLIFFRNL